MLKMLILIMATFTLFGCTAKKMAIDNADSLIAYQVSKDLPLNTSQKDQLKKNIKTFLNTLKPQAKSFQEALNKFDPGNLETLDSTYKELEEGYLKIAHDFSKILAESMASFDKTQQSKYLENQKNKTSKIKKSKSKIKERLEYFIGKMTEEQHNLIAAYSGYFAERAEARINRRVKLQETFKTLFEQNLSQTEKEKLMHEAFVSYQKESLTGNKNLEMLRALLPTLNEHQMKHLNNRKKEIIDLLKYFAQREY